MVQNQPFGLHFHLRGHLERLEVTLNRAKFQNLFCITDNMNFREYVSQICQSLRIQYHDAHLPNFGGCDDVVVITGDLHEQEFVRDHMKDYRNTIFVGTCVDPMTPFGSVLRIPFKLSEFVKELTIPPEKLHKVTASISAK